MNEQLYVLFLAVFFNNKNMKTQVFSAVFLAAALTATSAEASFLTDFAPKLEPVYELVDKYIFLIIRPMVTYGFFTPVKSIACNYLVDMILGLLDQTADSASADVGQICIDGVDVWVQNYYNPGNDSLPVDTTWEGTI